MVRFDCFEVDLTSGELRKNGIRIHLREQAFQAMALLLDRPGPAPAIAPHAGA